MPTFVCVNREHVLSGTKRLRRNSVGWCTILMLKCIFHEDIFLFIRLNRSNFPVEDKIYFFKKTKWNKSQTSKGGKYIFKVKQSLAMEGFTSAASVSTRNMGENEGYIKHEYKPPETNVRQEDKWHTQHPVLSHRDSNFNTQLCFVIHCDKFYGRVQ